MNKEKQRKRLAKSLKRRRKELDKVYWWNIFVAAGIVKGERRVWKK